MLARSTLAGMLTRNTLVAVAAAFMAVSVPACASRDDAAESRDTWVGTITTEGDATKVVNESGSVWGGPARLVEEASIGVDTGEDPYMLGLVTGVAAHGDRIYVADAQVPAIRIYDRSGSFIDNLGREGSGPGEYRYPMGVGTDADGRVYTMDMMTGRLLMYSREGEPLATSVPLPCCRNDGSYLMVTPAGQPYVVGLWRRPDEASAPDPEEERIRGLLAFDLDGGIGEVIAQPDLPRPAINMMATDGRLVRYEPAPFQPRPVVGYAQVGALLAGFSDTYRFEVRRVDGERILIERAFEPAAVSSEEAAAARRGATAYMRQRDPQWQWDVEEMPATKPAYFGLAGGIRGEAWAVRLGPGAAIADCTFDDQLVSERDMTPCFREPRIVDAFDPSGRYLGAFDLPEEFRLRPWPWIDGETVIAVAEDEAGTIMVKRYRLVPPGGESR